MDDNSVVDVKPGKIVCPECNGKGTISAFVDTETEGRFVEALKCHRCKGIGAVDSEQEEWMRIGKRHNAWRVAECETILRCANRLGIGVVELSDMERGRKDPSILLNDLPEILRSAMGYTE